MLDIRSYNKGEIWWAKFPVTKESLEDCNTVGERPVLILNAINFDQPFVLVAPITGNTKRNGVKASIISGKPSVIMMDHIRPINVCNLVRYMGTVSNPRLMDKVFKCFDVMCGRGVFNEHEVKEFFQTQHEIPVHKGRDEHTSAIKPAVGGLEVKATMKDETPKEEIPKKKETAPVNPKQVAMDIHPMSFATETITRVVNNSDISIPAKTNVGGSTGNLSFRKGLIAERQELKLHGSEDDKAQEEQLKIVEPVKEEPKRTPQVFTLNEDLTPVTEVKTVSVVKHSTGGRAKSIPVETMSDDDILFLMTEDIPSICSHFKCSKSIAYARRKEAQHEFNVRAGMNQ